MSDCEHVTHEFIPKLLRRKVETALKGREQFLERTLKELHVYLLANRNYLATKRKYRKDLPSIRDVLNVTIKDLKRANNIWNDNYTGGAWVINFLTGHYHAPHWRKIKELYDDVNTGSKWVDELYQLHNNLKKTPTRRVTVSATILSSMLYWQQEFKP